MASRLLIPGTLGRLAGAVSDALEAQGRTPLYMGELEDADIVCGQGYVDNDVCIAGIAAIGQTIRFLQERRHEERCDVLACEICKDCRALSMAALLPDALRRAGLTFGEVVEFSCAELSSSAGYCGEEPEAGDGPRIGIAGNAAMLASPFFTRTVVQRLALSGCTPVLPPLGMIVNEKDFLELAVEWFAAQGVRSVIGMLAFGCLGGHAYARGKARALRKNWPQVELTLLDYDRDASDINLINRTELVIQAAKERQ